MTEQEYNTKMTRIEEIFDAEEGTPESDELGILIKECHEYEEEHFPIEEPSEEAMVEFRRDQESN